MASVRVAIERISRLTHYHNTGPEVVEQALHVLEAVNELSSDFKLNLESHPFGGCAIDAFGEPLPPSTLKACQEADAILMGKWFCPVSLNGLQ